MLTVASWTRQEVDIIIVVTPDLEPISESQDY